MPGHGSVHVLLVDADTGRELARTELAADALPTSFGASTRLEIGGAPWSVVLADPPTAAEFTAAGRLVLMVRRIESVGPREVGYTLPTFYDPLPPSEPAGATGGEFVMHEDDWRQTELVSQRFTDQVRSELRAVRQITERHSRVLGEGGRRMRVFSQIHVRRQPAEPLAEALPYRRLLELLPAADRTYPGVGRRDAPGRIADSFALALGPLTVYGHTSPATTSADPSHRAAGLVRALGLARSRTPRPGIGAAELVDPLGRLMSGFGLLLVDWPGARLLEAADLPGWLDTAGPGRP